MNWSHLTTPTRRTTLPVRVGLLSFLTGAVLMLCGIGAAAGEGRLATREELRQIHDAGQYRICVQQIGRVLRAGNAGQSYDQYDLLLLRGDCLLHLEDPASAQLTYSAAAKSPVAAQSREGRAMAFLLESSARMAYRPRDHRDAGDGIYLVNEQGRRDALKAILEDELRSNKTNFDRASKADNLGPIRDVLPKLQDLYAVERTATGGDAQMRPVLDAIGQRARTLIERELDLREQTVAALDRRANLPVDAPGGGWWWAGYARRGLNTYDRRELRELIEYLQRVEETTRLGRELATSFDDDTALWEPLIHRAVKAARGAQDVLDAE